MIVARVQWLKPPSRNDLSIQFNLKRGQIFTQLGLDLYAPADLGIFCESYDESKVGQPNIDTYVSDTPISMAQFMNGTGVTMVYTPEQAIFTDWSLVHKLPIAPPVSEVQIGAYAGATDMKAILTSGQIKITIITDGVAMLSNEAELTGESSNLVYNIIEYGSPYHYAMYIGGL